MDAYKTIKDDIKSFFSTWLKKGLVINPQIGGEFFANPLGISSKHWFFENERDYIDSYVEAYEKNLYFCAIDDGSCFQIRYEFESDKRNTYVKEASLSFLPCVTDGTYSFDYIRIDYDLKNQSYFHPTVHMHVGFNDAIRIPMDEVPKFSDFFGLVMYLYYPEKYLKLLNIDEIKHTPIRNEQGLLTKMLPISEEIRKYTYLKTPDNKSIKL